MVFSGQPKYQRIVRERFCNMARTMKTKNSRQLWQTEKCSHPLKTSSIPIMKKLTMISNSILDPGIPM
jgi:hypothetical protein